MDKDVIMEKTEETIYCQKGQAPWKPWITREMIQEMEERRKCMHQSMEEVRSEYRRLNNKLRRTTKKERECQCREIEEL